MAQEHNDNCIVSVAETTEGDHPSFLASPEAMAALAEILEMMSPEDAQEALENLESQKVGL